MSDRAGHRLGGLRQGGGGQDLARHHPGPSLAQAGRRILLVDCDLGLANVDIQLGLVPHADLGAVVGGRR